MAVFKLGAIVTDIVGSIGGTNFRRGPTFNVISNKSFGTTRTNQLSNMQLNPIANIFKRWNTLSALLREDWNDAALLFTFPDKFGVLRNLTGRQLFTKLNTQLLPLNQSVDDPAGINSTLDNFTINSGVIDISDLTLTLNMSNSAELQVYLFQGEVKKGIIISPTFTRRKVFHDDAVEGTQIVGFGGSFSAAFPYFSEGYDCIIYATAINSYGFKSQPVAFRPTIIP